MSADPALLNDFIAHVLGYEPSDPVFISDQSSLTDFGDDEVVADLCRHILERYGLEVTDPDAVFITNVLEHVRATRQA